MPTAGTQWNAIAVGSDDMIAVRPASARAPSPAQARRAWPRWSPAASAGWALKQRPAQSGDRPRVTSHPAGVSLASASTDRTPEGQALVAQLQACAYTELLAHMIGHDCIEQSSSTSQASACSASHHSEGKGIDGLAVHVVDDAAGRHAILVASHCSMHTAVSCSAWRGACAYS